MKTWEFNTSTWVDLSITKISPVPKHRNMKISVLNQYYLQGYVNRAEKPVSWLPFNYKTNNSYY
jgi:hypothetical protein